MSCFTIYLTITLLCGDPEWCKVPHHVPFVQWREGANCEFVLSTPVPTDRKLNRVKRYWRQVAEQPVPKQWRRGPDLR